MANIIIFEYNKIRCIDVIKSQADCFVDAQGNLIGQPVIGTDMRFAKREIRRVLEMDSPRSRALQRIHDAILYR